MRASKPLIPVELLLTRLNDLAGNIRLIPEQAAMVLGLSIETLKERRSLEEPPPFIKVGAAVRYLLEDVRNELKKDVTFKSTAESREYRRKKEEADAYQLPYPQFGDFLNHGCMRDQWLFARVNGKPVDFFESLKEEIPDDTKIVFLTLGDYLDIRLQYEREADALERRKSMEGGIRKVKHSNDQPCNSDL